MSSPRRTPPASRALLAVLAGLLVLVGAPPLARAQGSVEVRIGAGLDPASVSVGAGTTVTWINDDDERHRMRSIDDAPEEFDSGNLERGERFSHTFRANGTTRYVDERDEDDTRHHGSVVVGAQPAPPSEPDSSQPRPGTSQPSGSATHSVSMAGRRFSPATLQVTAGDTVLFVNDDDREHTATADDDSFDSGMLAEGGEYRRTFERAGTFSYLCLLHPDMTGTIAVAGADGTAPPPASPEPDAEPESEPEPTSSARPTEDAARPSSPPSGGDAAAPERRTVQMRDFSFAPAAVEVPAGSTIVFQNTGRAPHTATATDGSFDSDVVSSGAAHEQRFDRPGTFDYTCLLHPEMTGEVVVTAATGGTSAAPAPPPSTPTEGAGATSADPSPEPQEDPTAAAEGASDPSVPAEVSVVDDAFLPAELEVSVGEEVVWTNDGEAAHTVTAQDGSFDSGIVASGDGFRRTFEEPGTVAYLCAVHPGMTAEVRVLALTDGASSPDLDPTAAAAGGGGRPSTATLQLLMLGLFAVALAGFTALSRRFAALDGGAA